MLKGVYDIPGFRHKVIFAFETVSRANPFLRQFFYEASLNCSVFIVGGFLRSVANSENPRDIDVIMNMSNQEVSSFIRRAKVDYTPNRFNGYKINFKSIYVDLWTTETNWAFASKVITLGKPDIISRVAQGTFYNFDSLVFDLRTEKVNVTAYNDCVATRTLDIIRRSSDYIIKNPGKISNIIRALRIRHQYGLNFTTELCRYFHAEFTQAGLYEKEQIVFYLYNLLKAKSSLKYKLLQDLNALRAHIDYIYEVLDESVTHSESQLTLF